MSEDEKQNSAARLHDILVGLREQCRKPGGTSQREALSVLLSVSCTSDLHERLADLLWLPKLVGAEVSRAGLPQSHLAWVSPVEKAFDTLSGSPNEGLDAFSTSEINDAIIRLEMCRGLLDEDSFEMEDIDRALEAVNSAIEEVAAIEETICTEPGVEPVGDMDAELAEWLLSNLRTLQDVLTTAKALGLKAAKRRMHELVGRLYEPRPSPKTDAEKGLVEKFWKHLGVAAEVMYKGAKLIGAAKEIGQLTD